MEIGEWLATPEAADTAHLLGLATRAIRTLQPDPSYPVRLVEAERERIREIIKQHEDRALINETDFDSVGERCLISHVKHWEARRIACKELLAAINKEGEQVDQGT